MNQIPTVTPYPRIIRRIKASCLDGVVVAMAAIGTLVVADSMGIENISIKIACAIFIVLLLEPLAVAFTGGTIGHHAFGMRVRRKIDKVLRP